MKKKKRERKEREALMLAGKLALKAQAKRFSTIMAASNSQASRSDFGNRGTNNEDAQNQEYLYALDEVIQRSQNLDVNNPDLGGFHRTRVGQIVGAGVTWKHAPKPDEIDLDPQVAADVSMKVNRLRQLHSETGGFDSTGKGRSEGKQQERAILTMLVTGGCLIHRVSKLNPDTGVEFSIELIPGSRVTTPYEEYGNPLVSYGIRYSDAHRTEVVGYYIRSVSKSIGNSFVPDFTWRLLPVEDCVFLEVTEQAGLDRALPLSVRVVKQLRNQGEMIENIIESGRAQSKHYAVTECAPGQNPFQVAEDDSDYVNSNGIGFTDLGEGVRHMYNLAGQKTTFSSCKLPDPDFKGFILASNGRLARGLNASLSAFTREVSNSFSAGKMEESQDHPIIAQYRESFLCAWRKVNRWFTESIWLSDAVEMPGYSASNAIYWSQYRGTFPGKVQINPEAAMAAREKGMMLRTLSPQRASEEDGTDSLENLREWAQYVKAARAMETEMELEPHSLDILFSGRALTTESGADITPATIKVAEEGDEPDTGETPKPTNGKTNGHTNGHASRFSMNEVNLG